MFVRRWLVGLVGVVLMFGNVEAQAGGFLSADMFTDPVPVLMDLPWQPYVHAKAEVTPDGQHISFIKFPLPTQLYTAEWTWIASEGQYGWGNETHVPIKQMWAGGSCISPDKQWLFYGAAITGPSGTRGSIYRSSWVDDHWGPGESIDAVNDPFTSTDQPYFYGSRLYFHAHTHYPDHSTTNIYYSDYAVEDFGAPVPIDAIDDDEGVNVAGYSDEAPSLTPDGQTLFWHSNRPGGEGETDIWMSNWESGFWGTPINLGPTINTAGWESDPSFNGARNSLYFDDSDGVLVESSVVPAPSTLVGLLSMGLVGLVIALRRRFRKAA